MDLQLGPSIDTMKVYIKPENPLFIGAIKINKASKPIRLGDVSEYKLDENNHVKMKILNENYSPEIYKTLWKIFGRENVHHPDRYTIIIDSDNLDLDDIIIHNPEKNLKRKIYDAFNRIMPEGFRVIKDMSEGNIVALLSTDELIEDEWIEQAKELIEEVKNS